MFKRILCLLIPLLLLLTSLPAMAEQTNLMTVELDASVLCLMYGGQGHALTATIKPEGASGARIYWMSDNEAVATVDDNGIVTPQGLGTATITAQVSYLQQAVCTVTVTDKPATSISISETELVMEDRTAYVLEAEVSSETADPFILWSSSNKSVAVVNQNGKVFAKSPGECWISATSSNGIDLVARCKLTVTPSDKPMKYVALTFDDGPCSNTLDILDILAEYDVHATFFCLGNMVEEHPDYVRKAYADGHEIANHSYSHETLTRLDLDEAKEEMQRADEAIKNAIGIEASVYRAPGGSVDEEIAQYCGKPFIDWTVDTNDWKYRDSEHVWTFIAKNTVNYDIVLMHDIRPTTMEAMHKAVPYLLEQGFTLITISELLDVLNWNDPSLIYEP